MIDDNQTKVYDQTPTKQISNGVWRVEDHIGGFDSQGFNQILSSIEQSEIRTEYVFPEWIKQKYSQHQFKFDAEMMIRNNNLLAAVKYTNSNLATEFDNFLCCFNRSGHNGRQWLVESLHARGLFDPEYCSKGFELFIDQTDCSSTHEFKQQQIMHGVGAPMDVKNNLTELSPIILKSFLNLVSETVPESYVPFPTEKFLFPILNKRLWVAYAQPGYHKFIVDTLGFQLYDFLDYSFDSILDPHQRLATLLDKIEPYSKCTKQEWHTIHREATATIEHNYQWVTSGKFINRLRELNEVK